MLARHAILRSHGMAALSTAALDAEVYAIQSSRPSGVSVDRTGEAVDDQDDIMAELERIAEEGLPAPPSSAPSHRPLHMVEQPADSIGRTPEELSIRATRMEELRQHAADARAKHSLPTRKVRVLTSDDDFLQAVDGAPDELVLVCLHDESVDECRRLAAELPRLAGLLPSITLLLAHCSDVAPKFDPVALPALVAYM